MFFNLLLKIFKEILPWDGTKSQPIVTFLNRKLTNTPPLISTSQGTLLDQVHVTEFCPLYIAPGESSLAPFSRFFIGFLWQCDWEALNAASFLLTAASIFIPCQGKILLSVPTWYSKIPSLYSFLEALQLGNLDLSPFHVILLPVSVPPDLLVSVDMGVCVCTCGKVQLSSFLIQELSGY